MLIMKQSFELPENVKNSEEVTFKEKSIQQEQEMLAQFQGEKTKKIAKVFTLISEVLAA